MQSEVFVLQQSAHRLIRLIALQKFHPVQGNYVCMTSLQAVNSTTFCPIERAAKDLLENLLTDQTFFADDQIMNRRSFLFRANG